MRNRILALAASAVLAIAVPLGVFFEGTVLVAEPDPIGIPTACHGHTLGIKNGMIFTPEQCKELLKEDLLHALSVVDSSVKGQLSIETRAALALFILNVGEGNFRKSTLLKKLNSGDIAGACNQLPRWVYAGGKKFRGLEIRREKERQLCLSGL